MSELPKTYDPKSVRTSCKFWSGFGFFRAESIRTKPYHRYSASECYRPAA